MFKVKYILSPGDPPHYRYLHALNISTAKEMFFSQYSDTGYKPTIVKIWLVEKDKSASQI